MRKSEGAIIASALGVVVAVACGRSSEDAPKRCRKNIPCVAVGGSGGSGGMGGTPIGTGGRSGMSGAPTGGRSGTSGASTGGVSGGGGSNEGGAGEGGDDAGGAGGDEGVGGSGARGGAAGKAGAGGALAGAGAGGVSGAGMSGAGTGGAGMSGAGAGGKGCGVVVGSSADTLIDNLEDDDNRIAPPRTGYWWVFKDSSCTTIPAPDPDGRNPFDPGNGLGQNNTIGAALSGTACTVLGAGLAFDLNNCDVQSYPYSARVFQGITFWYRSTLPLRLSVTTLDVIPMSRGGNCTPGGAGLECDNPHGIDLPASAPGTTMSVAFTTLSQSYGRIHAFDKTKITNVTFQVGQSSTPWSFAVDDLAFTP